MAFRTQDGVAHVMDAYCPHLGANLGVMGRVVGDCIECPFHGWRFRGKDGVCTHVPYASKGVIFIFQAWSCMRLLQIQRFVAFLPRSCFEGCSRVSFIHAV